MIEGLACSVRHEDWGLGIGDWGLGLASRVFSMEKDDTPRMRVRSTTELVVWMTSATALME